MFGDADMEDEEEDAGEGQTERDEHEDTMKEDMDGEVDEEEEDDNGDFHPLLLVQRAVSADRESLESSTQVDGTAEEDAEEEEKTLVDDKKWQQVEEEDEEEDEEDGYSETAEGAQQIFSGSAEFIGELDGEDKFFELATDYEEEELEDVEQEERDREYLGGCFNGIDHDGDNCCVEEEGTNAQQNSAVHYGKGCSVAAGNSVCGTKDKVDEDYKNVNEDFVAPHILQQPRELAGEVVGMDEKEGKGEGIVVPVCRRTRARYSLADMSLDQLEMFLQGSDEDDDFQAVDDREEYEKFLRAVLEDPPESEKQEQSSRKEEEDDEEEDVDFDIEIEELLVSDDACESVQRRKLERPETREKRRQRAQFQSRGPLRRLLPHVGSIANDIFKAGNTALPFNVKRGPPASEFTADQIGQLYSLMHEHVQLLVQTHSLCVWDPSRQIEATNTRNLLLELAEKREFVLSWKETAFSDFCFRPPYIHPSAIEGVKRKSMYYWPPYATSLQYQATLENCSQQSTVTSQAWQEGAHSFPKCSGQVSGSLQHYATTDLRSQQSTVTFEAWQESAHPLGTKRIKTWAPVISGPVRSLLDVAPLALVRDFLKDMSQGIRARFDEFRQLHVEAGSSRFERLPFFEIVLDDQDQSIGRNFVEGTSSRLSGHVELLPACLPPPHIKQTMAAALVESTEKQGLAPVPKDVAVAVQRFLPYFNKALYPHKAPPLSSSGRLLFADSEDELLAMGMMNYNHDWSCIRKDFLPSKTDDQIKIRAKNRRAAKAHPNSIKAVHMMKTSPLTDWEKKAIQEGLKKYNQNWEKIWLNCVPHRNHAILKRQWRIAVGTQKSYKTSESSKERRRLYEASRRQKIAAQKARIVQTVTDDWIPPSSPVVASSPRTASAERWGKLLTKKRVPKTVADNHSSDQLPWLDPQAVKRICNDSAQAVKLAPHLSPLIMPPHVQVLSGSDVQPQQLFPLAKRLLPAASQGAQRTSEGLEKLEFSTPADATRGKNVTRNKKAVCDTIRETRDGNHGTLTSPPSLEGSQQFSTFFAVGSTDPCTDSSSRSRNTGRNRNRKQQKRQDLFPEDPSPAPVVEQHIVMEQEELSDSEDEGDAGVEFEHEEMGDSDKER